MSTPPAADPNWAASDLLEHARRLAALASAPTGAARTADALVAGVRELHARCVRLEIDPVVADVPSRHRARLVEAFDRLACAADDLAAIVQLRCADADAPGAAGAPGPNAPGPNLPGLLARVAERHDHVVALLGRAGVRRGAIP